MNPTVLGVIRSQLTQLKMPSSRDKVYKDECMFSFDSPFSETGLYVNLVTCYGYSEAHFLQDALKTGHVLYLHEKWDQVPIQNSELNQVVPKIPEFVSNIIQAIIDHDGMKSMMQLDTWSADQEIFESKYAATLPVLDNGKKISQDPKTWACESSGQTENLWLNLSTGFIGGGRKNWDGTGGSGAALQHYLDTGKKYPLCVKLGTITVHGGDVWSYAEEEDTLVKDSLLAQHLSHWGIDIMRLEKTDKTMGEMEVDLNMKYDWSKILESGESLQNVAGAGLVGLRNIGSSCYLNSVMQVLVAIPELSGRYLANRPALLASAPNDASSDFAVQMSKLCNALETDKYVDPLNSASTTQTVMEIQDGENRPDSSTLERYIVAPRMFKQLVGKDHPEFSSGRQQDAGEYFQHLLQVMTRAERVSIARMPQATGVLDSAELSCALFHYYIQSRDQCCVTQQVRYGAPALETMMLLNIPLDRAVNKSQVDEAASMETKRQKTDSSDPSEAAGSSEPDVKLVVPFEACLDTAFGPGVLEDFANPALGGERASATRIMRMKTFPPYLMIKMNRYVMGPNWVSVKVDASVAVPEHLDLEQYRAGGLQPGEVEMPSSNDSSVPSTNAASAPVVADEGIVAQLTSMGFSAHGSQRAAIATHNQDADAAMAWVFAHMEDANFNDPIVAVEGSGSAQSLNSEAVDDLCSMGFTLQQVQVALGATGGDPIRAADWLFSRDNLDAAVAEALAGSTGEGAVSSGAASSGAEKAQDGLGKYTLLAIISHIGKSTSHGHYVAHIKKNGQWVLFNDEKVAISKQPPLDAGFMYLFKRD